MTDFNAIATGSSFSSIAFSNIFLAKSIIGADSINGISRKFVIGSDTKSKQKKIFRAFSFKTSSYQLARNSLQLIITSIGHFVIYPTIIDKKNATNYIFVSADDKSTPPVIHDKILSYLIAKFIIVRQKIHHIKINILIIVFVLVFLNIFQIRNMQKKL